MSFSIKAFLCVSLLGAMGFLAAGPGPQDGAGKPGGDAPVTGAPVTGAPADALGKQQGGAPQTVRDRYEEAFQVQSDFKAILDTFYATKDGPEKEAKRAELKKKLTDIFDADMKARKAQAEEIEKRLNSLQEQYKAREAAKERIIDLQIEVLEKNAEGLGFPAGGDGKWLSRNREASNRLLSNVAVPDLTEAPQGNSGSSRTSRPLQQVLLDSPVIVEDLKKRGHFIVSDDQKLFAHVGGNYPQGPWTITLKDSESGKVLANYVARTEVAEIRFQEGGVGVRMHGGKFEVRIPLDPNKNNALPGEGLSGGRSGSANPQSSIAAGGGELDDYSKLRNRYLNAKVEFDRISNDWKNTVEEDRKKEPSITIDELRARYHTFTPGFDWAKNAFQEASSILETKLKLLALDVEAAKASLRVSEAELLKAEQINKNQPGFISESEIRRVQLEMDKHKIELMRTQTILDLFQSIKKDGEPKTEAGDERRR